MTRRCICNPKTEEERNDLARYGCPEEICPACYSKKHHDDPYCQECLALLEAWGGGKEEVPLEEEETVPKILYILQGVPGSGKSTIANYIAQAEEDKDRNVVILSTDDWRFDDDGIYVFDPEENVTYHKSCQRACADAMLNGTDVVIIDNTNIQEWQAHPYLVLADIFDYQVQVVSVDAGLATAIQRQQLRKEDRRVPDHVIIRMYEEMERLLAQPRYLPKLKEEE
jgi:predicted kinase